MSKNKKKKLEKLFRNQKTNGSDYLVIQNGVDDNDNVAISFQYLQEKNGLDNDKLTKENKIQLLKKIALLTQRTWNELILSSKKSGFEKMDKNVIKNLPTIVTEDIKNLYVARFASQGCRLIGFRQGVIYYILFIDPDLKLYKH